ncbi:hypothetical protein D3C72_1551230 [compost metagenome]
MISVGAILIPKPSLVRLKSTISSSSACMRAPLLIKRDAAPDTFSPAFSAARYDAVIWMVWSGLRMSCPSIPRNRLRARSTCMLKKLIDSATA